MKGLFRRKKIQKGAVFISLTLHTISTLGQLSFVNPTLESGTALTDGAIDRFDSVTTNVDALITILGRFDAEIATENMDISGPG